MDKIYRQQGHKITEYHTYNHLATLSHDKT